MGDHRAAAKVWKPSVSWTWRSLITPLLPAANLSRAGRSHSVMPTLTPATTTPQAPPLMPAPPDA